MSDSNPYESPVSEHLERDVPGVRWRIAPTLLLGTLGIVFTLVGLAFCGVTVSRASTWGLDTIINSQLAFSLVAWMFASGFFFALGGVTWIYSARSFWKRSWLHAWIACTAGFLCIALGVVAMGAAPVEP